MISTDAIDCAVCGSAADTGYNGDDFPMNVKRARCHRVGCVNHFTLLFAGDVMLTESIPNVDEWNAAQRAISEGASPADAWGKARRR